MDLTENLKGHFKTITSHKIEVMKLCFKVGLYKQGILHDLSKYSPAEFIPGVIFFTGDKSPHFTERQINGMSTAWLHHKGRNKHHFEYWTDSVGEQLQGVEMPKKYIAEMFCDRVAASKIYGKERYTDRYALDYFLANHKKYLIHPKTKMILYKLLYCLAEFGEERTLGYIKDVFLK